MRNLVPEDGFLNLKKLDLDGGQYKSLIDSITNLVAQHIFKNLISTELKDLKLKEICHGFLPSWCFSQLQEMKLDNISIEYLWKGPIEPPSLCNIKSIELKRHDQITILFSQSTLKCLVKLQKLKVSFSQIWRKLS